MNAILLSPGPAGPSLIRSRTHYGWPLAERSESLTATLPEPAVRHPEASPRCASRRELWAIALLLLVAAAAVYGPHVFSGGFTVDDYGHAVGVDHPRDGILQDYWQVTSNRPGLVIYIPLTHVVFGPHPSLHIALAILLAVLMSTTLYALMRRLAFAPIHASAVAVLVLLFPWSDSSVFWAVAGHISLAIAFGLGGVILALRGLEARADGRRRRGRQLHAGAVALYALSVLTYETAAVALLFAGALYLTHASWPVVRRRWIVDVAVILPCLVWNATRADRERPSLDAMIDHAGAIADAGGTVFAWAALPFGEADREVVLLVLLAVICAAAVVRMLLPRPDEARPVLGRWIAMAGAGVLIAAATWVLYIPADPYYSPTTPGVGNRVNVMAAVGVVIGVYAVVVLGATLLFRGLPGWKRAASSLSVAVAAVLAIGYAADVRSDQQAWARAETEADAVLDAIQATVPNPPPGSVIYTFGHPGNERPGISIFGSTWDLLGAVQLRYDDPGLRAYPVLDGTTISCLKDGLGPQGPGDWSPERYGARYGSAYFVNVSSVTAGRIDSREQCEIALPSYVPGPVVRVP